MNFFQKFSASELGTTKFVLPALLPNPAPPPAPPFVGNIGERGIPQKMLDISVDDSCAMPVTISISAEYDKDPNTGNPAVGGPLVGILQWGVGGGRNQVEFDIPTARVPDDMAPAGDFGHAPVTTASNGIQIYLAGTSHVSLTVRNDASTLPLTKGVNPVGLIAAAKVIAFVSPGGSQAKPLQRSVIVSTINAPLAVGTNIYVTPPPFAKSVRFERYNASHNMEPLDILTYDQHLGNMLRIYHMATNEEGPIELSAFVGEIGITNTGASAVDQLTAVFDVTPT